MRKHYSRYYNLILLTILIFSIVTVSILFQNIQTDTIFILPISSIKSPLHSKSSKITNTIECSFNNNKNFKCLKSNNQVYVPFNSLKKQFDLHLNHTEKKIHIYFSNYNNQIYSPTKKYQTKFEYLWFSKIDVESRDRVKYISLKYNIPISLQWNQSGHIYPVQIGQFGLSHFSKWSLKSNLSFKLNRFQVKDNIKFVYQDNQNAFVNTTQFGFKFKFQTKAIYKTNYSFDHRYLVADLLTRSHIQLVIDLMLQNHSQNYLVQLVYFFKLVTNQDDKESIKTVKIDEKTFRLVFTFETTKSNHKFVRNFCLDACKGLKLKCDECLREADFNNYKVYQIGLEGDGLIENATLRSLTQSPHYELARQAGDYLVEYQNKNTGGWAINVVRKFDKKSKIYLKPGWYSAMAQGHSISLLCRLYSHSKEDKYLIAASKALNIYDLDVNENGVRSYLMDSINNTWYEEYPTQPNGLYVLNGFIYSLIGLYDYIHGCNLKENWNSFNQIYSLKAKELYLNGMNSLIRNVNLFDSGTRSFYDLRHLMDMSMGPNTARWDYHVLHISQLNYLINMNFNSNLVNVSKSGLSKLGDVAKRWLDYTKGKWNINSQIKI